MQEWNTTEGCEWHQKPPSWHSVLIKLAHICTVWFASCIFCSAIVSDTVYRVLFSPKGRGTLFKSWLWSSHKTKWGRAKISVMSAYAICAKLVNTLRLSCTIEYLLIVFCKALTSNNTRTISSPRESLNGASTTSTFSTVGAAFKLPSKLTQIKTGDTRPSRVNGTCTKEEAVFEECSEKDESERFDLWTSYKETCRRGQKPCSNGSFKMMYKGFSFSSLGTWEQNQVFVSGWLFV